MQNLTIKGDEVLTFTTKRSPISIFIFSLIGGIVSEFTLVMWFIMSHSWGLHDIDPHKAGIVRLILFTSFIPITILLFAKLNKSDKNEVKNTHKTMKIYSYFRQKFPILQEFRPFEHANLGMITRDGDDQDSIMFSIYMEAYKADADAIIINSSNTATHVSGSVSTNRNVFSENTVSGSTSSSNSFHIMATLVKYEKNNHAKEHTARELEEVH